SHSSTPVRRTVPRGRTEPLLPVFVWGRCGSLLATAYPNGRERPDSLVPGVGAGASRSYPISEDRLFALAWCIMGFFGWLFGDKKAPEPPGGSVRAGSQLDHSRLTHLFERPPSFSLVFFEGDVTERLPDLLERCNYKVLRMGQAKGPLINLAGEMDAPR